MKKTLYSLMLDEDIVREIDILARRSGVTRSGLINEILADYVQVMTPERRINQVLQEVEQLLMPSRQLIPYLPPNSMSMSMKSSLAYKYRPTVKYEVELYRTQGIDSGSLSVVFRTQSAQLIDDMTQFFVLWKQIEDHWFTARGMQPRQYELYRGKFVRSISMEEDTLSTQDAAQAIADYVQTFDTLMKAWLAGSCTPKQVMQQYDAAMESQSVIL